jgi:DNA-binding response OmpR family regulator
MTQRIVSMRKPRLLLVDDEKPFVENLLKLLSRRGYEVSAALDGDSALRLVQQREFDVVILDQNMPGKDSITLLRELKKIQPRAEVVILTGYGSVDMALKGFGLGIYDYISKPVQLRDLEARIHVIITQMGGVISVRSEAGKGGEFDIFLPCRGGDSSGSEQTRRKDSNNELDEKTQATLGG